MKNTSMPTKIQFENGLSGFFFFTQARHCAFYLVHHTWTRNGLQQQNAYTYKRVLVKIECVFVGGVLFASITIDKIKRNRSLHLHL